MDLLANNFLPLLSVIGSKPAGPWPTDEANGTFAPELTHALHEILEADLDYDLLSINGGQAPLYGTDQEGDDVNSHILADKDFQNRINNTIPASQINIEDYAAIFYPGGFGILSDLATNESVAKLSAQHYENGGIISAVCHGPAGLLPITLRVFRVERDEANGTFAP